MPDSLDQLPLFSTSPSFQRKPQELAGLPFVDVVRRFEAFGQATLEKVEGGIRYLVNEFWTAGQRQAHSIHEISYRACFKPQLPRFFIERLTAPGERVYDPFMGRGTTVVEAGLLGRRPAGNDINPLSVLLTRPRLRRVNLAAVERVLEQVDCKRSFDTLLSRCGLNVLGRLRA
jgi:DNA modification methylase